MKAHLTQQQAEERGFSKFHWQGNQWADSIAARAISASLPPEEDIIAQTSADTLYNKFLQAAAQILGKWVFDKASLPTVQKPAKEKLLLQHQLSWADLKPGWVCLSCGRWKKHKQPLHTLVATLTN